MASVPRRDRERGGEPVVPSLLDRLIDDAPDRPADRTAPTVRDVRASVRRDLENLLNTRMVRREGVDAHEQLRQSILTYGLPDFSAIQLGVAEHKESLRQAVQTTIERFEPRLRRVSVQLLDIGDDRERVLHLRISAVLMMEPEPVPLHLDSRVHAADRMLRLRERHHG